jgi:hypothetical protein
VLLLHALSIPLSQLIRHGEKVKADRPLCRRPQARKVPAQGVRQGPAQGRVSGGGMRAKGGHV